MFCKYCGAELADTAAFCNKCGKPTTKPESRPPRLRPQAPAEPPRQEPPKYVQPEYEQPRYEQPKEPPRWAPVEPFEPEQEPPRRKGGYIALAVILCVLVIGAIVVLVMAMGILKPTSSDAEASPSPSDVMETQPIESEPPEEDDKPTQTPDQEQSSYPIQLDMDQLLTSRINGTTFREAWEQGWLDEWMNLYVNGSSDGSSPYEAYWYDDGLREWTYYGITYSQAASAGWGDIWLELLGSRDDDDPDTMDGDYLLPTDSQYIDKSDLAPFTKEEVSLIRNEIYARYGYQFSSQEIQDYFDRQNWYTPVEGLNASTFDTSVFNAYEQANLETILAYEREMGWRQ